MEKRWSHSESFTHHLIPRGSCFFFLFFLTNCFRSTSIFCLCKEIKRLVSQNDHRFVWKVHLKWLLFNNCNPHLTHVQLWHFFNLKIEDLFSLSLSSRKWKCLFWDESLWDFLFIFNRNWATFFFYFKRYIESKMLVGEMFACKDCRTRRQLNSSSVEAPSLCSLNVTYS